MSLPTVKPPPEQPPENLASHDVLPSQYVRNASVYLNHHLANVDKGWVLLKEEIRGLQADVKAEKEAKEMLDQDFEAAKQELKMQLKAEKELRQKVEEAKAKTEADRDKWEANWETEHASVLKLGNEIKLEKKAKETFKDKWLNAKEQLNSAKRGVEDVEGDNRTLIDEKRSLADEVKLLQDEKASLQHIIEVREQSIGTLQKDNAQWKTEAERAIKEEEQGKKEQARLRDRIAALKTNVSHERKTTIWSSFLSNTFRSLWRTTTELLRNTTEQLCNLQEANTKLSATNESLRGTHANLRTELKETKTKASELDTQNKKLQEALSDVRAAQVAQAQAQRSCDEALGLVRPTPTVITATSSNRLLEAVDSLQDAAGMATQGHIVGSVASSDRAASVHNALPEADTPNMPPLDDCAPGSATTSNARARSIVARVQQERNLVVTFDAQIASLLRGLESPLPSDCRAAPSSWATRRSAASDVDCGETNGSEDGHTVNLGNEELQEDGAHSEYAASGRRSSETPVREPYEGNHVETKLVRCEECRMRHRRCAHKKAVKVKGRCSACRVSGSKTKCTHPDLIPGLWHPTSTSAGSEVHRSGSRNRVTDGEYEHELEGTNGDLGEEIRCSRPQQDTSEVTDSEISEIAAVAFGTPEPPLLRSAHNFASSSSSSQTPSRRQHRSDVSASPQRSGHKATERRDSQWPWPGLPDESIDRPSKRQRLG